MIQPFVLTVPEFARLWKLTKQRAYEIARRPELVPQGVEVIRIGKQVRFLIAPRHGDSSNEESEARASDEP